MEALTQTEEGGPLTMQWATTSELWAKGKWSGADFPWHWRSPEVLT